MKVNIPAAHRFFLGANTPTGFVSRMNQLASPASFDRVFIIKGGPGTGKSTLLGRVAEEADRRGQTPELICCSFDPDSLDAVVFGRTAVLDGTAPHAIDCRYPGAVERLVCLGDCWDEDVLAGQRARIISLVGAKQRLCEQSCRYLAAAAALLADTQRLALDATDTAKIDRLADRLAAAEFKGTQGTGSERVRLLSALTASGSVLLDDTAERLARRIYLLEDDHGPSAALLLAALRRNALDAACDIISCYSPLAPYEQLEHLFIPALSLGFMTANDRLHPRVEPCRVINARRFTDKEALSSRKKRISFNRKAARQMVSQAQALLSEAGQQHQRLESCYQSAMDFSALDRLTDTLLQRIFAQ